jgi:pimeloyl-ACP methyl ester carboxylesterase
MSALCAAMVVALLLTGCFRGSLLPFSLEQAPQVLVPAGRAGVTDGRARFREIWCAVREDHGKTLPEDRPCEEAVLRVGGEGPATGRGVVLGPAARALRIVAVPGIYAECFVHLARPFSDGLAHLATHGYRTDVIMVSGRSSSRHNAAQIRDAVMAMALAPQERLVLVGHSKGSVDILESLVAHPQIVARVAAVVSVGGAINGSPLADGLRDIYADVLREVPARSCDGGDGGALASLQRGERLRFLATSTLPASVRYFSVTGIVGRDDTSRLLRGGQRRLDEVDPLNDGQVLWSDAVIPGATLLGYVRADHWAIAMPFSRTSPVLAATVIDHNAFPREVLLEAIVRAVEESL